MQTLQRAGSSCCLRPLAPHVPVSAPSSSAPAAAAQWQARSLAPRPPVHRNAPSQLRSGGRVVRAAAAGGERSSSDRPGSSNNGGRPQEPRRSKPERKARKPGLFEVMVPTPPPRSLGVWALPPNTHNGDEVELDGDSYVVTGLVLQYKLQRGKYVRHHSRLEVQPTGRYFLNMMLNNLIHATYMGETGRQD